MTWLLGVITYFQQCNIIESDAANVPLEGQLYKDKKILKSIIENYAIRKKFQFKVKRSSVPMYYSISITRHINLCYPLQCIPFQKLYTLCIQSLIIGKQLTKLSFIT